MVKVLVGSRNPVKLEAAKKAFSIFFNEVEVAGIAVDSKVSSQRWAMRHSKALRTGL